MNPTTETAALAMTMLCVFGICCSIVCRVIHMHPGVTTTHVFVQHFVIGVGMLGLLVLPTPYGGLSAALGVFIYLLMGSGRWRFGAPPGTHIVNQPKDGHNELDR